MTDPIARSTAVADPVLRSLLEEDLIVPVEHRCLNCAAQGMLAFYAVADAPVHSVLLMQTRSQAVEYPRGTIRLAFCPPAALLPISPLTRPCTIIRPSTSRPRAILPPSTVFIVNCPSA